MTASPVILVVGNAVEFGPISGTLYQAGYQVAYACDGRSALDTAHGLPIRLVLLATAVLDRCGPDVLDQLRGAPASSPVPVVLVAAGQDEPDLPPSGSPHVADDILTQPTEPQRLLACIRLLLKQYELEAQLRASEARFFDLSRLQSDAVLVVDQTRRICFANSAAEHLFARSAEVLVASEVDFPLDDSKPLTVAISRNETIPVAAELRISPTQWNGAPAWLATLRELPDGGGDAQLQLDKSLALLRIAGRVARLGGWSIDLPERTLTWSDENCAIHEVPPGYRPTLEEGIGYFLPEHRAEVIRHVENCASQGIPYDFELPKMTAKGRLIWVRSNGEAVRDAQGKIVRLQGAFQDISEQKRAADILRQKDQLLHIAGRMARFGGWAVAMPSRRIFWSDEVADILEFPRGTKLSRPQILRLFSRVARAKVALALTRAYQGAAFDIEVEMLTACSRRIWVRLCAEADRGSDGTVQRVQGAFQDVTDAKQGARALQQANRMYAALSAVNEAIARAASEQALYDRVCEIATGLGGLRSACVIHISDNRFTAVAGGGFKNDQSTLCAWVAARLDTGDGSWIAALREGRFAVSDDLISETRQGRWPAELLGEGYRSVATAPLRAQGQVMGALILIADEPDFFGLAERDLVESIGSNLSFAVDALRKEGARRATEERYRFALDAAALGEWDMDLRSHLIFRSPQYDKGLGYAQPLPQWTYDVFLKHVYAPDRELVDMAYRRAMLGEADIDLEFRVEWPDGSLHWLWSKGRVFVNEGGQPHRLTGIQADITHRRQGTDALRRSEARFRLLFDHSLDGILITQLDGTVLAANRSACAIFGMGERELKQTNGTQLIDATDPRAPKLFELRHRGGAVRGELSLLRAGRHPFEAELSSAIFEARVDGGKPERLVGTFVRDVDERNQNQRRLRIELMRTGLLQQITRAIGDRLQLESVFQVVGDNVQAHLPADFVAVASYGKSTRQILIERIAQNSAPLAEKIDLSEGASVTIDRDDDLARCVDGELVHMPELPGKSSTFLGRLGKAGLQSAVLAPLQSEGEAFGLLIVARYQPDAFSSDEREFLGQLSEHVALAAQQARLHGALRQAYVDLDVSQKIVIQQERLRSLGQIASGIAHDINNAISPAALYSQALLEQEPGLSARARGQLETIRRAIDDVATTVNRLREFYRPSQAHLQDAKVDVNPLVHQVIELTGARWRDMAQRAGIQIEVRTELGNDLPAILAAESEIREALTNLVFNALDAMPGGGTLLIRTCAILAQGGGRHVTLEVADSGTGMDEQTRRRCLDPFFTTKGDRGTGLGLAMVYGTVQRHGGNIEIESAPFQGTTVRMTFPGTAPAQPFPPLAVPSVDAAPRQGLHVLVVDDDPLVLESLSHILETDGHLVGSAQGGQQGIDMFGQALTRGQPYDVVMTDLGMPHIDGRKVAEAIKAARAQTSVIMLTGWGQHILENGALPEHVDHLLGKPPRLAQVREALIGQTAQPRWKRNA